MKKINFDIVFKILLIILLFLILITFYKKSGSDNNKQKESSERSKFKEVKIGNQVWMAENLNVAIFRNGEPIPQVESQEEWIQAGKNKQPAWCYFGNNITNEPTYGKLYNWYAVNDIRGLAPIGWHVPSDAEWIKLNDYLIKQETPPEVGKELRSRDKWPCESNNKSGFTGLPGGYRDFDGSFNNFSGLPYIGDFGMWWSSTNCDYKINTQAFGHGLDCTGLGDENLLRYGCLFEMGLSIRCLKD